jgi:transposase-like protein
MENERLDTNPSSEHNASRIDPARREAVQEALRAGTPILEIAKEHKMSPNNVMAIKREMPESTGLRDEFKSVTVRNLKNFVQQASHKLVAELDNLHVSQIPIAMGIAIDKIQSLQDQPTAVVEHRFSITHETINKLLKEKGDGLKKAKEVILDAEVVVDKPKATSAFLEWSKDPKKSLFGDKGDVS